MNTFEKCEKRAASRITALSTRRSARSGTGYPPASDTHASASAGSVQSKPALLSQNQCQVEGAVNEEAMDDANEDDPDVQVIPSAPGTGAGQSSGVSDSDDDDEEDDKEKSSRDAN